MALLKLILGYFFSDENKEAIIKQLIDAVHIPMLNDATERQVFEAIFEIIQNVLEGSLNKPE